MKYNAHLCIYTEPPLTGKTGHLFIRAKSHMAVQLLLLLSCASDTLRTYQCVGWDRT